MSHHGSPCWYELATPDLAAAHGFYNAVMGWQIADSGTPGMDYHVAKVGDTMVAGMMTTEGQPTAWCIYFAVDSADTTFAAATAAGATGIVPPTDIPGTGRFAILLDPQGAGFAILQPAPGGQGSAPGQGKAGTWNEIITSDPEAATKFYGDLFGWTVSNIMQMGAITYYILACNGTDIGDAFAMPGTPNQWKPYFAVASVKASAMAVTAAGGTVQRGPDQVPGGGYTVQIADPQGATLALFGPL